MNLNIKSTTIIFFSLKLNPQSSKPLASRQKSPCQKQSLAILDTTWAESTRSAPNLCLLPLEQLCQRSMPSSATMPLRYSSLSMELLVFLLWILSPIRSTTKIGLADMSLGNSILLRDASRELLILFLILILVRSLMRERGKCCSIWVSRGRGLLKKFLIEIL